MDRVAAGLAAHDLAGDHPQVVSARGPTVRIRNHYLPRLHAAAAHDPVLATAVPRVTGLDPPTALLRPDRLACLLLRRRPRTVPVHDGGTSMISEIVRAAALRTADGGNGRSLAESIGRDR